MIHIFRIIAALFVTLNVNAKMPQMTYVVETTIVKPRPQFLVERRYIATIKQEKTSFLTPKTAGTVATIDVKPGQRVTKNQVLVTLTSSVEQKSVELAQKSLKLAEEKRARSRSLYKSHDITKSQLDEAEAEVLAAKSKLESQKQLKENVELRAPFDGIVGVPRVVLGESVQPQTTIISVTDGPFFAFINIPSSRLGEVNLGQSVKIKSVTGTISAVERSIDPVTRTGFAKVILPSCEACIIGDSVYATITVFDKPNAIVITKNAIYYKNQKPHVVVVGPAQGDQRQAEIREVTLGEEQEGDVEILSGLKDGDEVIIANPKRVPDKSTVRVVTQ